MTIHDTLKTWTDLLLKNKDLPQPVGYFCESFKTILELFKGIVEDDWVDKDVLFRGKKNEWFPEPDVFTDVSPARCDFCQADLWNRQFHCPDCTEEDSAYDICTYCFAQGRGCEHRAKPLEIVESCSMKSCRELVSRAIKAWNESEKLKEWEKYDQMSDPWENGYVSPTFMSKEDPVCPKYANVLCLSAILGSCLQRTKELRTPHSPT